MKLLTKHLRTYAAKILQAANLLDDLDDAKPYNEQLPKPEQKPKAKRRKMSKAGIKAIQKAQRKRWKLYHGGRAA